MDGPKTAKRKRAPKKKVRVRPEGAVKPTPAPVSVSVQPEKVNMRCLLGGAIIKANGPVTGVEYEFPPGKPVPVDSRDIDGLLARRTNPKRCCGNRRSPEPQPVFGLA